MFTVRGGCSAACPASLASPSGCRPPTLGMVPRAAKLLVLTATLFLVVGHAPATAQAVSLPGKPTAKAPTGTITQTKPTFTWGKAARATKYELRVYQGSTLVLKQTGITKLPWTSSKAVPTNVDLTWKVQARNARGAGVWSNKLTFKVVTAPPLSSAKAITAFSFQQWSPASIGTIDEADHTIAVTIPWDYADTFRAARALGLAVPRMSPRVTPNFRSLAATFTASPKASVSVDGVPQVSGFTSNDFRNPITYMVTAEDGSKQTYVVTVTIDEAPLITGLSSTTGVAGTSLTLTGSHFKSFGVGPASVWFSGAVGTITSLSDTSITCTIPTESGPLLGDSWGWNTSVTCDVGVWVRSQVSNMERFTITGITPPQPSKPDAVDPDNATPGDVVRLHANGFSPIATTNRVRFGNGVTTTALSFTADPWYGSDGGWITVEVPTGAASGDLTVRRTDGKPGWSEPTALTVVPATELTIALRPEFAQGFVDPYYQGLNVRAGVTDDWVLSGSGFSKMRYDATDGSPPGTFFPRHLAQRRDCDHAHAGDFGHARGRQDLLRPHPGLVSGAREHPGHRAAG